MLSKRAESYWIESRRPLASLVFVAPLLVVYEVGVLWLGVHQNGADAFLQGVFDLLGFGQYILAPALLVCILLGWHHLSHDPWRLSAGVISAMAVESLLLGICLWVIAFVQLSVIGLSILGRLRDAVGYLGAGIYEELLFRLILLSFLAWAIRKAGASARVATVSAVAASSLLFAAAHYVGPAGFDLALSSFVFRTVAGVFFAVVFIYRGFGIAAGSHAAYDLLVGLSQLLNGSS